MSLCRFRCGGVVLLIACVVIFPAPAFAEWKLISGGMPETGIRRIELDPKDLDILYVATERSLYKTVNAGVDWKRIMGSRSKNDRINALAIDQHTPSRLFVGTAKGLKGSIDGGKTWKAAQVLSPVSLKDVTEIVQDSRNFQQYWVGTKKGLWLWDSQTGRALSVQRLSGDPVYSVATDPKMGAAYCVTERGVWKSLNADAEWKLVLPRHRTATGDVFSEDVLDVQKISFRPPYSNILIHPVNGNYVAQDHVGLISLEKKPGKKEAVWLGLPDLSAMYLTASTECVYFATEKGVYQWNPTENSPNKMNEGLGTFPINMIRYDAKSDALYAATESGVFRWTHPEIRYSPIVRATGTPESKLTVQEIERLFADEPSIRQVQEVAVRYAELHPDKIKAWREAAAKKAWLPSVSVHQSINKDENIDLDRGGTGDPDHFIQGPVENSYDYYVGLSWDLGELVWNDDQTSIDTRSKLMVELRDDILTEVTHLYFERRRLQVAGALTPSRDIVLQMENKLKLDELTASIDALTGGYLTDTLARRVAIPSDLPVAKQEK